MSKRRFHDLEQRWIAVVSRGGSFTLAQGEEGDELYHYDQWKRGKNRELPEASVPDREGSKPAIIDPFDIKLPGTAKILSSFSGRTQTFVTAATATSIFNHLTLATGAVALTPKGYAAPRAIVSHLFQTQQSKTPSRITKRKYRPRVDDSYSIPFGKEGTKSLAEIQDEIKTYYTTSTNAGKYRISFTPEKTGVKIEVGT